jgi:dTDP-4-dehydrorhamnose 3,5-epimerase
MEYISGVKLVKSSIFEDDRGSLMKLPNFPDHLESLKQGSVILSKNKLEGTIRGLHFQSGNFGEKKIISCTKGKVFDVFLDLRPQSTTFCRWSSVTLSSDSDMCIFLPEGIAHGFQTLTDDVDILYFISGEFSENHSQALNPFDSQINILWPLPVSSIAFRDLHAKSLKAFLEELS